MFQALGEASLCWDPRPGNQVFDAQHAHAIGQDLLAKILAEQDRLQEELADAITRGQSMEGQCHDLEVERDRWRTGYDIIALDPAEYRHALGHVANCEANCEPCRRLAQQALDDGVDAQKRAANFIDEQDRLRAVIRALVDELGIEVKGDWLTYCYDEFSGPLPFDAEELATYQRALDEHPTGEHADE